MNVAALIARLLLGLWFLVVGASPFFVAPPPQPGLAGEFIEIFYRSHWTLFVGAAQLALGAQLLVNRFVPLALIVLAAFLYNSFAFHLLIAPATLFAPVIVLALWFLVAWPYRGLFATIFTAKPSIQPRDMRDDEVTPLGAGHPIAKRFAGRVTDAKSQAAAGGRTEDRTMDGAA